MATRTHIFFDFFGTLVDYSKDHRGDDHQGSYTLLADNGCGLSYEAYLDQWAATFDQFVHQASESLDEFSMDELCGHFLKAMIPGATGTGLVGAFRDSYLDEWSRGVSYIPGLDRLLDGLASGYRLAVVSNTHHGQLVRRLLHEAGIAEYFSAIVTSVEHGRRKPCPTIYRHALAATGGRVDAATFVGDSFVQDYAGPRAVGMHSLLIDPDAKERVPEEHRLHHILDVRDRVAA